MTPAELTAPARIDASHDLTRFDCATPDLNDWLVRQALKNEESGASRTYVVCHGGMVIAYYCLAAGAVNRAEAPKRMQRNMPNPVPVMVLGRLGVDRRYQGQGIGRAILRDAIQRVLHAAEIVGIKAVLVHAISQGARRFYLAQDFLESPMNPMTLCLELETARLTLAE
jgi:GNAT superfamily N-acetyltransferase